MTAIAFPGAMPIVAAAHREGAMADIESPCNKVCVVDPASRLCIGCGRTLAEIGGWIGFTPEQRRHIMAELPGRLAALPQPRRNRFDAT